MRSKTNRTKKETMFYSVLFMRIAAILGCLTLVTLYLLSGAYSKFYSSASGADNAKVAEFSPDFTFAQVLDVENATPGYTDETEFSVKNFSGEKMPEVAMKYKIILKTTGNIPLKFTVCKSDGSASQDFICDGISGKQEYVYSNDSFVFGTSSQETQTYKLKAEWQADKNDARFSGMTDAVCLEVEFLQID
ncbi:MAG: hypothetical protein ACI4U6_02475 [Acutalibacteraceae bacterium]